MARGFAARNRLQKVSGFAETDGFSVGQPVDSVLAPEA
jgi:hypothetical protein